jgi:hypothetical protein
VQPGAGDTPHQPADDAQPRTARPGAPKPGNAPNQPERGRRGELANPVADKDFSGKWEQYVRDFITRYSLDEGQTQKAQSYLKDCITQGERYVQTRQATIDKLDSGKDL